MDENHLRRVFFALWPSDSVRDEISNIFNKSIYAASQGQVYNADNLHLTLHFLGGLTSSQLECAMRQAAQVQIEKFELLLDGFGSFERAKILWLGPTDVPNQLTSLHAKLANALDVCDVPIESRVYRPHLTLMRKFKGFKESQVLTKVLWSVDKFALLESISTKKGVEYRPLKFYSLGN